MKKMYSLMLLGVLTFFGASNVWAHTVSITVLASEACYLYAWDINNTGTKFNGEWGSENDIASNPETGVYTYSIDVTDGANLGLIFRNRDRDAQTMDIKPGMISSNVNLFYDLGSGISSSNGWYIKGAFNSWGDNMYVSYGSQAHVYIASGSTLQFGVQSGDTWYAAGNSWENYTMTCNNVGDWWGFARSDTKNMEIAPTTISGYYTFIWNNSTYYGTFIYPVQLSADGYATFYSTAGGVEVPENVDAYYLSSKTINGQSVILNFSKLTDYIPASTPVILKGNANEIIGFTYSNTSASVSADGMFKGVKTTTDYADLSGVSDGDYVYVLAGSGTNFGFHRLSDSGSVNASRCYLVVPAANSPATAPAITMWLEDENGATAIPVFGAEENNMAQDNAIYTILGQRVNSADAPGVYIRNGKKFIVK